MSKKLKVMMILGESQDKPNMFKVVEEITELYRSGKIDYEFTFMDFEQQFVENQYYDFDSFYNYWLVHISETVDVLLFLTPVYSYYMSGVTHDFLRQMTYVQELEKKNRRISRNKYVAVISTSNDAYIGNQFFTPFRDFARNNDMEYLMDLEICLNSDYRGKIPKFLKKISKLKKAKY